MRFSALTALLIFGVAIQPALSQPATPPSSDKVLLIVDQKPAFPGGEAALEEFFKSALSSVKYAKGGVITLSMVVTANGQPKNIDLAMGVSPEIDAKVLERAQQMPKWQPGLLNGKPVNARVAFPVVILPPQREQMTEEKRKQVEQQDNYIYTSVEQMPLFPGGEAAFAAFFAKNFKYPVSLREKKIEGNVFVQFVVSRDGNLKDITMAKGLHPDINAEVLRVIKSAPKFIPGKQNGDPVNVQMVYPFRIRSSEAIDK